MAGSPATARATATRCCCPPESWAGKCFIRCAIPTRSSAFSTRCLRSALFMPRYVSGSSTFSYTVMSPSRLNAWKMNPICRLRTRARSAADSLSTASPASTYVPSLGVSRSPRIESNVVFPQPDGPEMATYSPSVTEKCTSASACVSTSSVRNTFLIPSSLMRVLVPVMTLSR